MNKVLITKLREYVISVITNGDIVFVNPSTLIKVNKIQKNSDPSAGQPTFVLIEQESIFETNLVYEFAEYHETHLEKEPYKREGKYCKLSKKEETTKGLESIRKGEIK